MLLMRKLFLAILTLLVISCKQHRQSLAEQLTVTFSNHLKQIDSATELDSVHILWKVMVTERLGRIIDDSTYVREFTRIKAQLGNAQQKNDKDSIEFYQYEINYMEKEIDSLNRSIPGGDITKSYGSLIGCAYYIRRNNKTKIDSTILFIDSASTMRYTEYMDSAISRTIRTFN